MQIMFRDKKWDGVPVPPSRASKSNKPNSIFSIEKIDLFPMNLSIT